jgi:hypothetical protein
MNRSTERFAHEGFRAVLRLTLLVAAFALMWAGPVGAQITRGVISGTVRDVMGAVIPGATVTVTNMETNASRTALTDQLGFYRVAALEPGRYSLRAELSGFSTVENRDLPVRTATEVTLNVELPVGRIGEALTVIGKREALELNKTNPTIGLTSTARQAVELPLSAGRNINNLVLLTPNTFNVTATPGGTNVGQGGYVVNGQRSRNNNYMIDG